MKIKITALTLATVSAAFAQNLYVDTNGTGSGFGSELTASWDDAIWKLDTNGGTPTSNWTPGAVATFGSGFSTRNLAVSLGASDVSISGLTFNHATTINSTGGALTSNANVLIAGGSSSTIAANLNLGTAELINTSTATVTLSGTNTLGALLTVSGTLEAGSTEAFGSGTLTVAGGNLNLNAHNVTSQVITGNLTSANVINAQNYTGTVYYKNYVSTNALVGYEGPNRTANGVFTLADIVVSAVVSLQYQTTGNITLENEFASLELSSLTDDANQVGSLTVNAGRVFTDGSFSESYDTLTVNGDLILNNGEFTTFEGVTMSGTSELYFSIGKFDGFGNSKLIVNGTAYLAGDLIVTGFSEQLTTFDLIDASTVVGTFDNIVLPYLNEGFEWDTSQLYTLGQISITAIPEPSTAAALAGILSLSLAYTRRKRR
jgi:fibronectin-binding autotransporter adhesin